MPSRFATGSGVKPSFSARRKIAYPRAHRTIEGTLKIEDRERYLRIALQLFGAIFILVYFLMRFWPAGWQWMRPKTGINDMNRHHWRGRIISSAVSLPYASAAGNRAAGKESRQSSFRALRRMPRARTRTHTDFQCLFLGSGTRNTRITRPRCQERGLFRTPLDTGVVEPI